VIEYVRGTPLLEMQSRRPVGEAIGRIEELVATLHARGVIHGDLHQENVLIDEDGNVFLLDWATAHVFSSRRRALEKWVFDEYRALDLRAVAKIKIFFARERMTPDEYNRLADSSRAYRLVKRVRRAGDALRGKKSHDRLERAMYKFRVERAEDELSPDEEALRQKFQRKKLKDD
jgi:RIO-like serine/threonine protein kinase